MHNIHPQSTTRTLVDSQAVDHRLQSLGINRAVLNEAILQGELQRRFCTSDDYRSAPGFVAWNRRLRTIHELLRPQNWHQGDFLQIPVAFNENETIALATSAGNEKVGFPGDDPTTSVKGPATRAAVEESSQVSFEFDEPGVELWYLLVYVSEDGEVRAELSRPTLPILGNRLSAWDERIILGRIDPIGSLDLLSPVDLADIDIQIRRTAS